MPGTSSTLKFTVQAGSSRTREAHSAWGFGCRVHGFEPAIAPKLPLMVLRDSRPSSTK